MFYLSVLCEGAKTCSDEKYRTISGVINYGKDKQDSAEPVPAVAEPVPAQAGAATLRTWWGIS